jgi:hypothetical protein
LTPGDQEENGCTLYSGLDTLCKGDFYFLGLNPAVDKSNVRINRIQYREGPWSAYLDQCWRCAQAGERLCEHYNNTGSLLSPKPHQKRVVRLMAKLGAEPRKVMATNCIFLESTDAKSLDSRTQELWERHWPIHQSLLDLIRPKIIVCLGLNKSGGSPYWLIQQKILPLQRPIESKHNGVVVARSYEGHVPIKDSDQYFSVRVMAVRHPSRWDPCDGLDVDLFMSSDRKVR